MFISLWFEKDPAKSNNKISKTSGIYDILFMIMCSWICHLHSRVFQVHLILFYFVYQRTIPLAAKAVYRLEAFQSSLFFDTYIDFFFLNKTSCQLNQLKEIIKKEFYLSLAMQFLCFSIFCAFSRESNFLLRWHLWNIFHWNAESFARA